MPAPDRRLLLALVLSSSLVSVSLTAEPSPRLPYRTLLTMEWGEQAGPASFRTELEEELLTLFGAQGCFRTVLTERPDVSRDDDLLLRVFVDAFEEEMDFEYGLGAENTPGFDPRGRSSARVESRFEIEVRTLVGDRLLREDRFMLRAAWRPVMNEDPRYEAQRALITKAARKTLKQACKGSPSAWRRLIARSSSAVPR